MIPVAHYMCHNRQRLPAASAVMTTVQYSMGTSERLTVPDAISQRLTPRENEILLLLYEGHRYREIAGQLYISLTTVRAHHRRRGSRGRRSKYTSKREPSSRVNRK